MTIKAILFDMDGVLIEAKDWHYEALNKALSLFGITISRYEHLTNFDGLPTRKKLEMLTIERGLPAQLHEFINEMKQIYTMNMVYTHCKPCFVHEYALSYLKAQGYYLAVCSNSVRNTVITMMEKSGLLPYFDLILSNEDVEKGKPSPDIYEKAMQHFNLEPNECLVIEDNKNGIRAAQDAGAHVLVVQNVDDTNYHNIKRTILKINANSQASV